MPRGVPNRARAVLTPGEPVAVQEAAQAPADAVLTVPDAGADDDARELETPGVEIDDGEQGETAQEIADRTGRPHLDLREGWVLPSAPNPNVAKIGGR